MANILDKLPELARVARDQIVSVNYQRKEKELTMRIYEKVSQRVYQESLNGNLAGDIAMPERIEFRKVTLAKGKNHKEDSSESMLMFRVCEHRIGVSVTVLLDEEPHSHLKDSIEIIVNHGVNQVENKMLEFTRERSLSKYEEAVMTNSAAAEIMEIVLGLVKE